MISAYNLTNHALYADLLIKRPLVNSTVGNFVELVTFWILVAGVKL